MFKNFLNNITISFIAIVGSAVARLPERLRRNEFGHHHLPNTALFEVWWQGHSKYRHYGGWGWKIMFFWVISLFWIGVEIVRKLVLGPFIWLVLAPSSKFVFAVLVKSKIHYKPTKSDCDKIKNSSVSANMAYFCHVGRISNYRFLCSNKNR